VDEVVDRLGTDLPQAPTPADQVVDLLAEAVEPGLVASPSGRFFGFVIGGAHPAALAADRLVGAWDQNSGIKALTPGVVAAEQVAARWLLDLLGLPPGSGVGFVTGATMSNFTCLAAARDEVLRRAGHDVRADGLVGAPPVRVLVGRERHDTVDVALHYLGLGRPEAVSADDQGRMEPDALVAALRGTDGPAIVVLQAGNVHSGAFDPFPEVVAAAHEAGAWVHVDGAFGLFAAASPRLRHLTAGCEDADSWTTDAHKTLNVPYDCGIAVVRDAAALRGSMGMHGDYLIQAPEGDPLESVPETSRRGRGVPVWAVLRALGRDGVAALVEGFCDHATAFAEGITAMGGEVLNDVVFTQVCTAFGSDERTRDVVRRMLDEGEAWTSGSLWHGRAVLRISVCNWSTTPDDVRRTLSALRRAAGVSS
jgi:glutamate/tyrosine decarboxylase-like PLP-dependent enzyme